VQIFTASTTASPAAQQAATPSDTTDWQSRLQQLDDADISVLTTHTSSSCTNTDGSSSSSNGISRQQQRAAAGSKAAAKPPAVLAPWLVSQLIAGIPSVEDCGTVEDELQLQLVEQEADVSSTWSAASSSLVQRMYRSAVDRVPVAGKARKEEGRLKV
jgi:hypothetical protein